MAEGETAPADEALKELQQVGAAHGQVREMPLWRGVQGRLQCDGDLPDRHPHRNPVLHPATGAGENLEGDDWMKRRQIGKWLMLMVMLLVATVTWGDLAVPPPRVLSHSEWLTAMGLTAMGCFGLSWVISSCSALAIFLVVLVISIKQRRPSYLMWLAWCTPLPLFVPITYEQPAVLVLPMLGVLAVSWLVPVIVYFRNRKFVQAQGCLIVVPLAFVSFWCCVAGIVPFCAKFNDDPLQSMIGRIGRGRDEPIEARKGESYEEYLKRANRIIHHHCDRCDKPMKNYWHDYWLCPDCDKGEMTCSKCGAQKEQEPMGPYWQYGFEWICPNCDKDRREEIKRQVEEKRNRH